MNPKDLTKAITNLSLSAELLKAVAAGKKLQFLDNGGESLWADLDNDDEWVIDDILLYPESFRIKPEPEIYWAVVFDNMSCSPLFKNEEKAKNYKSNIQTSFKTQIFKLMRVE
jgi:hypothetical protein